MTRHRQFEYVRQHFSEEAKRLNPGFASEVERECRDVPEPYIQRECEKILENHGYKRRTQVRIAQGRPPSGWYIHLHRAEDNPILLDLLILHNNGTYLEVELKTKTGRLSRHQGALISMSDACILCRSVMEFWDALKAFEKGKKKV